MNSRKLALSVVKQVFNNGSYSNIAVNNELKRFELSDKDKGLATEIVYGTIKYKYKIDKDLDLLVKGGIQKLDDDILNILRISLYQIAHLERVPDYAVVNDAVTMSKKISIGASKLVNGVLRNYIRSKSNSPRKFNNIIEQISYEYSFEPWMTKLLIKQYGEECARQILQGSNEVPALTVRVNTLKTDYDNAKVDLIKMGYEVSDGAVCPEAIRIVRGGSIENNLLFREGKITVQDESAMLVASSMEIKENMTLMDLCSAPGGKCTHMAELMNNTGSVMAFDIHENKLNLIKDNAVRLGLDNIQYDVLDAAVYVDKYKDCADRVLIDVPCSGLGIIRKKPEIKWGKKKNDLESILDIQKAIISNAAKYVKKHGILMYSTCTLNKWENEDIVSWFLANNNNFTIEKLYFGKSSNILYHSEGMVSILPNECMDGFFMTKLRRLR
jgi:16S rRNA (cytosine967-C5)-methyltransferase